MKLKIRRTHSIEITVYIPRNPKCSAPVRSAKPLFSKEKGSEECRFEKGREDAFHGERQPDDSARPPRKLRPVCPKLQLGGNARNEAQQKVNSNYSCPELRGNIVLALSGLDCQRLQDNDE